MFTDFAVQCTWEGDNTVMALQTARYLVSSFERLDRGEGLTGSVEYLMSLPRINRTKRVWGVQTEKVPPPPHTHTHLAYSHNTGLY